MSPHLLTRPRPITVLHACGHESEQYLTGSDATLQASMEREAEQECPRCRTGEPGRLAKQLEDAETRYRKASPGPLQDMWWAECQRLMDEQREALRQQRNRFGNLKDLFE